MLCGCGERGQRFLVMPKGQEISISQFQGWLLLQKLQEGGAPTVFLQMVMQHPLKMEVKPINGGWGRLRTAFADVVNSCFQSYNRLLYSLRFLSLPLHAKNSDHYIILLLPYCCGQNVRLLSEARCLAPC